MIVVMGRRKHKNTNSMTYSKLLPIIVFIVNLVNAGELSFGSNYKEVNKKMQEQGFSKFKELPRLSIFYFSPIFIRIKK